MRDRDLLMLGGAAVGALLLFPQLAGWLTRRVVGTGGTIITSAATGAVVGIGEAVGIPDTDADKCAQYIAAGDHWNASFYCPAGTFLADAAGDVWDTVTGAIVGHSEPPPSEPEIIRIRDAAPGELPGIADYPYPGGA